MTILARARRVAEWFFSDEEEEGPGYDPIHVAVAIVATLTVFGVLYWILWALLVYEGGLFSKLHPIFEILFTPKTLKDVGYQGPWDRGPFEGLSGNLGALAICALLIVGLRRLWR